ncbi:MAG: amidohydrolase family protein [Acidobacteria bacterium]|nr:amidohydrolase family protein [Acidobacteriota bacterium]
MIRRFLILSLLLAAWVRAQDVVAIAGAIVVDGTGAPPARATVLIRGDRIAAVGADVVIPPEARVIRAEGQTLLPGLFDIHTHLLASPVTGVAADWGKILKAYLYAGVTTVVDVSTYGEQLEPMRRLIAAGLPAPKLLLAVRFSTPGGHGAEGGRGDFHTQEIQTAPEARAAVRRVLPYKPDLLKVFTDGWRYGTGPDMTSMDLETLSAFVDEGHKNGLRSVSHTVTLDKAKLAARAGVDAVIHGIGDAPVDDELVQLFRTRKTAYATTLAVYESHVFPNGAPRLLAEVLGPDRAGKVPRALSQSAARQKRWQNLTYSVKALRQAGLPVACGTDAGMTSTFHGYATHREIELLAASGLSPLEALAAATGNSARAIGVEADRGTIAAGRAADLLLVQGAPHENLADLARISRVFVNGREIGRDALRRSIHSAEPTPMTARAVAPLLDDFERPDGRSRIDTLWLNNTDSGHDHARMSYQRTLRKPGDHALTILAQMGEKERSFGSMVLPLACGGVEPVDLTAYRAIEFEARGDGDYALVLARRPSHKAVSLEFKAGPQWRKIRLPLAERYTGLLALHFRLEREAGRKVWLELDNLRLLR